jgi:hypothetical protein
MKSLLPILGILAGVTMLAMTYINTASAQDISEYTLLLNNAHFKNRGHCISQFPDIISNAHIAPNASPQEIRQLAIIFCKQAFPT